MRRTLVLALVAFATFVAVAVAAAPTATIDDVTPTSIKLGSLKCNTNYKIRLQTRSSSGTLSSTQTINQRTKTCPPPPPPPDADGDGVPDSSDQCPGTAAGTQVDANGCPVESPPPPPADSDGDGVPDSSDQCPGTAQGVAVDANGCPVDTPPPPPPGEPGPIAGQGYHEVFRDDFNSLNRFVWDDHIWYDDAPNPAWTGFQEVDSSGVLHLRTSGKFFWGSGASDNWPINTITTHSANKTFKYGYFEAKMKWPSGHGSWPAFWLISEGWADTGSCSTPAGEIDVMEGQGSEPNVLYGTVHKDSAGACSGHNQNGNNWQPQSFPLADSWHIYAITWTPTTVTWYLDGKQTHSAATYADDNQPMHMLLQEWVGGWTTDPDSTTPDPLDNQVDYVTVWQQ